MDTSPHDLNTLFAQLGLPNSDREIQNFIQKHKHLRDDIRLDQAPFWTPAQASFLQQAIIEDADWAEVVDQLDTRLRH